jgi:UDP-N-acetylmuramate: L-alanyl-gamma-D-glutamyl-meso-diaminopimelate ligase
MAGRHNALNAVAAIMAARHAGVTIEHSCEALCQFVGVKRRLDFLGERKGAVLYDDFAHHPTAISATLAGLSDRHPKQRLLAVVELRSNSMRGGAHTAALPGALAQADQVLIFALDAQTDAAKALAEGLSGKVQFCESKEDALDALAKTLQTDDGVVFMSNGDMQGLQKEALIALQ